MDIFHRKKKKRKKNQRAKSKQFHLHDVGGNLPFFFDITELCVMLRSTILLILTLQTVVASRTRQAGVQAWHVAIATSTTRDRVCCALGAVETHRTNPSKTRLTTCKNTNIWMKEQMNENLHMPHTKIPHKILLHIHSTVWTHGRLWWFYSLV